MRPPEIDITATCAAQRLKLTGVAPPLRGIAHVIRVGPRQVCVLAGHLVREGVLFCLRAHFFGPKVYI